MVIIIKKFMHDEKLQIALATDENLRNVMYLYTQYTDAQMELIQFARSTFDFAQMYF